MATTTRRKKSDTRSAARKRATSKAQATDVVRDGPTENTLRDMFPTVKPGRADRQAYLLMLLQAYWGAEDDVRENAPPEVRSWGDAAWQASEDGKSLPEPDAKKPRRKPAAKSGSDSKNKPDAKKARRKPAAKSGSDSKNKPDAKKAKRTGQTTEMRKIIIANQHLGHDEYYALASKAGITLGESTIREISYATHDTLRALEEMGFSV